MTTIEKRLAKIRQEKKHLDEQAKENEIQRKTIERELKEAGFKTKKAVKKRIDELETKLPKLRKTIEKEIQEIEEEYGL